MGLATGVKPYDVDVAKTLDFLINDYTRIRTKAFQASDLYDLNQSNEGGAIEDEFKNIQRNIWREQRRIYRAFKTAEKFGLSFYDIKKQLKERNISRKNIRKILNGDFVPLPFSETRFKDKIEELRKIERETGKNKIRSLNENSFYPKVELKDILRDLKFQRLDKDFYYDLAPVRNPLYKQQSGLQTIEVPQKQMAKLETPPLPLQPAAVNIQSMAAAPANASGLTTTETALLSPGEQAIRLRQKGIA